MSMSDESYKLYLSINRDVNRANAAGSPSSGLFFHHQTQQHPASSSSEGGKNTSDNNTSSASSSQLKCSSSQHPMALSSTTTMNNNNNNTNTNSPPAHNPRRSSAAFENSLTTPRDVLTMMRRTSSSSLETPHQHHQQPPPRHHQNNNNNNAVSSNSPRPVYTMPRRVEEFKAWFSRRERLRPSKEEVDLAHQLRCLADRRRRRTVMVNKMERDRIEKEQEEAEEKKRLEDEERHRKLAASSPIIMRHRQDPTAESLIYETSIYDSSTGTIISSPHKTKALLDERINNNNKNSSRGGEKENQLQHGGGGESSSKSATLKQNTSSSSTGRRRHHSNVSGSNARRVSVFDDLSFDVKARIYEFLPVIPNYMHDDLRFICTFLPIDDALPLYQPEKAKEAFDFVEKCIVEHKEQFAQAAVVAIVIGLSDTCLQDAWKHEASGMLSASEENLGTNINMTASNSSSNNAINNNKKQNVSTSLLSSSSVKSSLHHHHPTPKNKNNKSKHVNYSFDQQPGNDGGSSKETSGGILRSKKNPLMGSMSSFSAPTKMMAAAVKFERRRSSINLSAMNNISGANNTQQQQQQQLKSSTRRTSSSSAAVPPSASVTGVHADTSRTSFNLSSTTLLDSSTTLFTDDAHNDDSQQQLFSEVDIIEEHIDRGNDFRCSVPHQQREVYGQMISVASSELARQRKILALCEKWIRFEQIAVETPCSVLRLVLRECLESWTKRLEMTSLLIDDAVERNKKKEERRLLRQAAEIKKKEEQEGIVKNKKKKLAKKRSHTQNDDRHQDPSSINNRNKSSSSSPNYNNNRNNNDDNHIDEEEEEEEDEEKVIPASFINPTIHELVTSDIACMRRRMKAVEFVGAPTTEAEDIRDMMWEALGKHLPPNTNRDYGKTLTLGQIVSLGIADVPWVRGFAWQDHSKVVVSKSDIDITKMMSMFPSLEAMRELSLEKVVDTQQVIDAREAEAKRIHQQEKKAAEHEKAMRVKKTAIDALARRVWMPPGQPRPLGSCEICGSIHIHQVGLKKPGSAVIGDVAVCEDCYEEAYESIPTIQKLYDWVSVRDIVDYGRKRSSEDDDDDLDSDFDEEEEDEYEYEDSGVGHENNGDGVRFSFGS